MNYRPGQSITCPRYGACIIEAISPLGWPLVRPPRGKHGGAGGPLAYAFVAELVSAVVVMSEQAAAVAIGVHYCTISEWRAILGVTRMNVGTAALWRRKRAERCAPA